MEPKVDPANVLLEYGTHLLDLAHGAIAEGKPVLPIIVTLDAKGAMALSGLVGPSTAAQRQAIKEALVVEHHAVAVLTFSDSWIKAPDTNDNVGEMLTIVVETRQGIQMRVQRYTRDPLTFEDVLDSQYALVPGNTFGAPQTMH